MLLSLQDCLFKETVILTTFLELLTLLSILGAHLIQLLLIRNLQVTVVNVMSLFAFIPWRASYMAILVSVSYLLSSLHVFV